MSIGSIIAKEASVLTTRAGKKGAATVAKVAQQASDDTAKASSSWLKKILGDDWSEFVAKKPLDTNLQDQGPEWLTAISKRLDGQKRESVGLKLTLGVEVPTPVPHVSVVADSSTEAMLRRTPLGKLELVYGTEMKPGVAAQMRTGLAGGFSVGKLNVGLNFMTEGGGRAQAVERASLVYEVTPSSLEEMGALANLLKGHLLTEGRKVKQAIKGESWLESAKQLIKGKKAIATAPAAPNALPTEFAKKHLSQASFLRGADLSGNVTLRLDGLPTVGAVVDQAMPGPLKEWLETMTHLVNVSPSPRLSAKGTFQVGIEHTLDFDRGRYLKTTVAANSEHSLYSDGSAYGAWYAKNVSQSHRYAATYGAEGLSGVDYSVRMTVKNAEKRKELLQKHFDTSIDTLLPKQHPSDPVVLTYSLKPEELAKLKGLSAEDLQKQLPELFKCKDAFTLTRMMSATGDRLDFGGNFHFGLGFFGGVNAKVTAEHKVVGVSQGAVIPADPLPADQPWGELGHSTKVSWMI